MSRTVVVIIPTLDEADSIGGLLAQLARQEALEIIVTDGGSGDSTRAIVSNAALADPRIRLRDNPQRIQAAGINRAVEAANTRANTIVRIDAHSTYPDDYIARILAAFDASGATMVAVRLASRGDTCVQRGIAAAGNSRVGSGGSAHRVGGSSGFVDHGHHAGMDRAAFVRVGGYDESFVANEDAELDLRIRRDGGSIWLASDIEVGYSPRRSLSALAKQYWRYGRGRAQTYRKHGERLRLRQSLPPVLVAGTALAVLVSLWLPWILLLPLLYLAAIAASTILLFRSEPGRCTLFAAPATVVMHFAWGAGFIASLFRRRRSRHNQAGSSITSPQPLCSGERRI